MGSLNKDYTVCTARGLVSFNASCVCRKGRQTTNFFLFSNINPIYPITTKLNEEVSSSWASVPHSPCILCMPKDIERKGSPQRLKNPKANYKPP